MRKFRRLLDGTGLGSTVSEDDWVYLPKGRDVV